MDWDRAEVTYSTQIQGQQQENGAIDNKVIQSKFRQFLREFREDGVEETFLYRERLVNNYETRNFYLAVDYDDMNTFDPELSEKFRENPAIYLPLFESAAQDVVAMTMFPRPASKDEMSNIQIQIINVARQAIPIRALQADHISKLVRVPGIVTSSTKVEFPGIVILYFESNIFVISLGFAFSLCPSLWNRIVFQWYFGL